jgi:hypothetical protein
MAAATALPVMRQVWHHLAFLHWEVAAEDVARLLPPGLEVDLFEGRAYVGLVPFTITGTRPPLLPPLPRLSRFHEVNLRTYVRPRGGGAGDRGVWFFSLDAASRLAVAGARAVYKLPYFYARMAMAVNGDAVDYSSRRAVRKGIPPLVVCRYRPTGPAAPAAAGTLEHFLIERYLLYAWTGARLRSARVAHAPYPVQPAAVSDLEETLTAAAGLARPRGAPLAHYARMVDVRIYRPRRV